MPALLYYLQQWYHFAMPEIKVPKEKQPKAKKETRLVQHDSGEVVSAYSEEGQRRIKKSQDDKRKFIILFILVTLISIAMAIGVIILFNQIK